MAKLPANNTSKDNIPLTFGKYKGLTPNEVSDRDPAWLIWAFGELNYPPCSQAMAEYCRQKVDNDNDNDNDHSEDQFSIY